MRSGGLALLGVFACNGGGSSAINPGTGSATGTATGTNYVPSEVGLDERPENTSCLAPDRPLSTAQVQFNRAYSGVSFNDPIWIGQSPDVPGYWYVADGVPRQCELGATDISPATVFELRINWNVGEIRNCDLGKRGMLDQIV